MNFKGFFGTVLVVFGLFLLFGGPAGWEWPARISPYAEKFIKLCVDNHPYAAFISIILGLATLMTMRKD